MGIADDEKVYIADVQTILPALYESQEVFKRVYCKEGSGVSTGFAEKIVNRINITYRPLIIDPDFLPGKRLLKPEFSAIDWGVNLVNRLTGVVHKNEIGFFGVAYNVSSVAETLPNLSARICHASQLMPDIPPEEKISYGCASGILVLERARDYCAKNNKAAIVYVFDQCSWAANIILDRKHPDFKNSLINSMIFGDGGVGILMIPASMKNRFSSALLEICGIVNAFEPADTMHFDEAGIQLDDKIHEKIPRLAVDRVIRPLLETGKTDLTEIEEWSLHQGGLPILEQFCDKSVLGLTGRQIAPSTDLYIKYGNLSSASAFFVLHHHFQQLDKKGTRGILLSFGAGFYLGGLLYEKQ